jgi:hypothetical protein
MTSGGVASRATDLASLRCTTLFLEDAVKLMWTAEPWAVADGPCKQLRYRHLAFAMVSRAVCGVQPSLHSPNSGYPMRLWLLFDASKRSEVLKELEDGPDCKTCLFDPVTMKFRADFKDVGYDSDEALASLIVCGILLDEDVAELECLHASMRRRLRSRQTWKTCVSWLSTDMVLLRHRVLRSGCWWACSGSYADDEAEPAAAAAKKSKAGLLQGGGAQRSAYSRLLTGRGDDMKGEGGRKKVFAEAAAQYAQQKDQGGEQQQADERLGTLARERARRGVRKPFSSTAPSQASSDLAARIRSFGFGHGEAVTTLSLQGAELPLEVELRSIWQHHVMIRRQEREETQQHTVALATLSRKQQDDQSYLPGLTGLGLHSSRFGGGSIGPVIHHSVRRIQWTRLFGAVCFRSVCLVQLAQNLLRLKN